MSTPSILWREYAGSLLGRADDLDLVVQRSYAPDLWHAYVGCDDGTHYSKIFDNHGYLTEQAAREAVEDAAIRALEGRPNRKTTLKARLAEARDAAERADTRASEFIARLIATESALRTIADLCEQASVTAADESTRQIFEMLRATAEGV